MNVSLRWKLRGAALLGLLLATPGVLAVLSAGTIDLSDSSGHAGGYVPIVVFVLSGLYLPWSFLVERFEASRPPR